MNKPPHHRTLVLIAGLLAVIGMEGCISLSTGRATLIDSGGAIANIGQQRPQLRAESLAPQEQGKETHAIHYRVWKKGEHYIVQLPVSYAPVRYTTFAHFCGHNSFRKNTLEFHFPHNYYSDEELNQYPVEYFYATLTERQYRQLCRKNKRIKSSGRDNPFHGATILSAAEIDLSGAELVLDRHGEHIMVQTGVTSPNLRFWWVPERYLAPRRSWYNYCLMPLSWIGEVADIPLTIIATPIGWLADAIYEPLAN